MDYENFRQTQAMLNAGHLSRQRDWWLITHRALLRAERRYEPLDIAKLIDVAEPNRLRISALRPSGIKDIVFGYLFIERKAK